ncbi:protein phosphatase 2C domain-containing protein, partial [Abiotrophia sp. HMSC24B09]
IIHLGDGVIGYMEGSELKVASNPSNGEFVNTTTFITSSDAVKCMKVMKGFLGNINGFVLMTDGTSTSLYQKNSGALSGVIGEIFRYMKYLPHKVVEQQVQESLELVVKRATQDDCGIAFLTNAAKPFDGYLFLTVSEKADLLGIKGRGLKKRVKRYDKILTYLSTAKSQIQLSRYLKLKNKYVRRHLNRLVNMNFIEVTREGYRTILILSREY